MSEKFQENVTVLKQQCIGKDIYDMTIQTKHIAGHAKAGQFVSLYSNDASKLLPRPISLCGIDAEAGTLRLVYRVTGEGTGTEEFSRLKAGDTIRVLGPLGNGFTVEPGKKAFLIGGGIGIPPMLELAKSIKAAGTSTTVHGYDGKGVPVFCGRFKTAGKKSAQTVCGRGNGNDRYDRSGRAHDPQSVQRIPAACRVCTGDPRVSGDYHTR